MQKSQDLELVKLQQLAENNLSAALLHARADTSTASIHAATGRAARAFTALKRMCATLKANSEAK